MKYIIIGIVLTISLYGSIEINQNIKALYKGVELTEVQEEYILDNEDYNTAQLKRVLKKEFKSIKAKVISEKNVVSFILTPSGEINKIKFLKKSDNRTLDKATKRAINKAKFIKPSEPTIMRFIMSYRVGKVSYGNSNTTTSSSSKPFYQNISRGTTSFLYSSKEYVRVFETTRDGFINLNTNPQQCMKKITLLKNSGQSMNVYAASILGINQEASKGRYKLLLQTKKDCKINLQYP